MPLPARGETARKQVADTLTEANECPTKITKTNFKVTINTKLT